MSRNRLNGLAMLIIHRETEKHCQNKENKENFNT